MALSGNNVGIENNDDGNDNNAQTTAAAIAAAAEEKLRALEATKIKPFLISVTIIAALGGMLFGWDIGTSIRTDGFNDYFQLTCNYTATATVTSFTDQEELLQQQEECIEKSIRKQQNNSFTNELCSTLGCFIATIILGPYLFDTIGRRKTMAVGGSTLLLAAILSATTVKYVWLLDVFQIFNGIGIGILNMTCPAYIVEIAPIHRRGQLVTVWHMGVTTGLMLVSICNMWFVKLYYGWRLSYLGTIIICIVFIGLLSIIPESPHYLMMSRYLHHDNNDNQNRDGNDNNDNSSITSISINNDNRNNHNIFVDRDQKVLNALSKIRFTPQEVLWEYEELQKEVQIARERQKQCCYICNENNDRIRTRLLVGIAIQTIHQFSGINAICLFTSAFMSYSYGDLGSSIGIFVQNITNLLAEGVALVFVEKLGRPLMLFAGAETMFVMLCMIIWMESVIGFHRPGSSDTLMFCFLSFIYQIGYSFSWGPVSWTYCAEVFDITTRGRGTGITTFVNYFWSQLIIVGFIYNSGGTAIEEARSVDFSWTPVYTLVIYTIISFLAMPFVYFCVPETANKTSTEIGIEFVNHKSKWIRTKWGRQ